MKTDLTIVPSFIYHQGELISETDAEFPLQVSYYNDDLVEIKMLDQSDREVIIRLRDIKPLMKEILKHAPEASKKLKSK